MTNMNAPGLPKGSKMEVKVEPGGQKRESGNRLQKILRKCAEKGTHRPHHRRMFEWSFADMNDHSVSYKYCRTF
jgi:hypothetical protein